MGRFVQGIQALAMSMGAPGIFLVAFLDSSVLSLPEIADLLVIYMVTKRPSLFLLYVGSATIGSLLGCLLLYFIGKKGGAALVHKRFDSAAVGRTLDAFRRHGIMAVLVPSVLPPPMPFKPFVLLAGVADISATRFAVAILIGRGARYTFEGLLALWYGERAMAFMQKHGIQLAVGAVALLVVGFVVYLYWPRKRRADSTGL
jgi:membrane protein YqaA with SNARE-associated domain